MILELEKYDILAVNGKQGENFISILEKDTKIVIDHAKVEFKIFNELDKEIEFEVMSLSGKAEEIFKETNALVKLFAAVVKQKEQEKKDSSNENIQTDTE